MVEVRPLARDEIEASVEALARLRITVFREFPYLYAGDPDYERRYLETALGSAGAVVIGAFDATALVGAATAGPLADHFREFAEPFAARGWSAGDFFYFGESVLERDYRGQGIGHLFFDHREEAARTAGFRHAVFSSVIRPGDHPERPAGYRPLDGFWRARGYRPVEGLVTRFSWTDIGVAEETEKPMQFWMKTLTD